MAVHQTLPNGIELTIERVGNEQTPVVMIDNFPVLPELCHHLYMKLEKVHYLLLQ